MRLVQQPVKEGAVTGISQYPVSYSIICWSTSVEHLKSADAVHSIYMWLQRKEEMLLYTRDWLRTVTKWTRLPQWCDTQFICQTNYTQMPHTGSFLASQNFYSSPFCLCRIQCHLFFCRGVKAVGRVWQNKYLYIIMQLFPMGSFNNKDALSMMGLRSTCVRTSRLWSPSGRLHVWLTLVTWEYLTLW